MYSNPYGKPDLSGYEDYIFSKVPLSKHQIQIISCQQNLRNTKKDVHDKLYYLIESGELLYDPKLHKYYTTRGEYVPSQKKKYVQKINSLYDEKIVEHHKLVNQSVLKKDELEKIKALGLKEDWNKIQRKIDENATKTAKKIDKSAIKTAKILDKSATKTAKVINDANKHLTTHAKRAAKKLSKDLKKITE